jgi:hypothetical protein
LLNAGYVCIIDASIAPDYKKRIMEEVKGALCLGISLVTGPMIRVSLKIAEGLIEAGGTFKWSVQATTNLTARLSISELTLLRRSGLHQICQGIETLAAFLQFVVRQGVSRKTQSI